MILLAFIGLVIFLLLNKQHKINIAKNSPPVRTIATLVEKNTEIVPLYRTAKSVNYIIFELSNGERKSFKVSTQLYNRMIKNEKGLLTYFESSDTLVFDSFEVIKKL